MIEFNFKSQICTTREQSERLLSLGLKKETADMRYDCIGRMSDTEMIYREKPIIGPVISYYDIPAWTLHRLIEMALRDILICGISFTFNEDAYEKVIRIIEHQIKEEYFPKGYLNKE